MKFGLLLRFEDHYYQYFIHIYKIIIFYIFATSILNTMKLKKLSQNILSVLFILFISSGLAAQVEVQGWAKAIGEGKIYLSIYGKDSHQVIRVDQDGSYSCRLPRFEEVIMAFYQKNSVPKTVSINTSESNGQISRLNISLEEKYKKGSTISNGPVKRFTSQGGRYTNGDFDLDKVKDKLAFGGIMVKVNKDIKHFYTTGQVPSELIGYSSNMDAGQLRKSEHRLGQEVYLLLEKKRGLEKQIQELKAKNAQGFGSSVKECEGDLFLLKKEASLQRVTFELAEKEAGREKMRIRRYESSGKTDYDIRKMRSASKAMLNERRKYEIAALNMKNKQADCWAMTLQKDIDGDLSAGRTNTSPTIRIKQLDLSDVRMSKRLENSLKLYRFHNELASDLTGRERHVELANAQKHIAELEQIKEKQSRNALNRWEAKSEMNPQYSKHIANAKTNLAKQVEIAWQAEMAYLEHMWHLRDHPELEDAEADNLYDRQSGLLSLEDVNRRPPVVDVEEEATDDASLLSQVQVRISGNKRTIKMDNEEYVIIDDGSGKFRYTKNGKSITKLTYAFETKRKFGKIIENVKVVERRQKLMDLFKKRTLQ